MNHKHCQCCYIQYFYEPQAVSSAVNYSNFVNTCIVSAVSYGTFMNHKHCQCCYIQYFYEPQALSVLLATVLL